MQVCMLVSWRQKDVEKEEDEEEYYVHSSQRIIFISASTRIWPRH